MAALDAPTQPRIARSRQLRCPAPPPRRATTGPGAATVGAVLPPTEARVRPSVVPTGTLARPSIAAEPEPRRSRRWVAVLAGALVAGLATGAVLAVEGIGAFPRARTGPTRAQALRAVQRLGSQQSSPQDVSATFTVDQGSLFFDVGGRVRYRAVGQAQATVDFSAVGALDLQVRGNQASVRVPAAQLDPPVVDDSRSGVINRSRGLLDTSGGDVSASDVASQVQQQLSDAAQGQGIPATAQQLAAQRVREGLRRLGFAAVDVTTAGG